MFARLDLARQKEELFGALGVTFLHCVFSKTNTKTKAKTNTKTKDKDRYKDKSERGLRIVCKARPGPSEGGIIRGIRSDFSPLCVFKDK